MHYQALSMLPILLLMLAQPAGEAKAKKDLEWMQGNWVIQSLEINGKEVGVQQLEGTVLTVKGDEYHTKIKDKQLFGFRLTLDANQDPRALDMTSLKPGEMDKVHKAIYVVDKDTFKMCRGLNPDQARPNQFATWPDTNYFVVTWKRQPK